MVHADFEDGSRVVAVAEFSWVSLGAQMGGYVTAEIDFEDLAADARADWDPKNRAFEDDAAAADAAALGVGKAFADGAGAADAAALAVGKALADGTGAADAFSRVVAYARAFTDGAGAADTLTITSITRGGAISEATIGGHP